MQEINKLNPEVEEYINKCDRILREWDNEWAWETIEGIQNWIKEKNHITENQKDAIDNILRKIEEGNIC